MFLGLLDLHNMHKNFIPTQNIFISTITKSQENQKAHIPASKSFALCWLFKQKLINTKLEFLTKVYDWYCWPVAQRS